MGCRRPRINHETITREEPINKKDAQVCSPDGVLDVNDGPHGADHSPLLVSEVHHQGQVLAARLVVVVGVRYQLRQNDAPVVPRRVLLCHDGTLDDGLVKNSTGVTRLWGGVVFDERVCTCVGPKTPLQENADSPLDYIVTVFALVLRCCNRHRTKTGGSNGGFMPCRSCHVMSCQQKRQECSLKTAEHLCMSKKKCHIY